MTPAAKAVQVIRVGFRNITAVINGHLGTQSTHKMAGQATIRNPHQRIRIRLPQDNAYLWIRQNQEFDTGKPETLGNYKYRISSASSSTGIKDGITVKYRFNPYMPTGEEGSLRILRRGDTFIIINESRSEDLIVTKELDSQGIRIRGNAAQHNIKILSDLVIGSPEKWQYMAGADLLREDVQQYLNVGITQEGKLIRRLSDVPPEIFVAQVQLLLTNGKLTGQVWDSPCLDAEGQKRLSQALEFSLIAFYRIHPEYKP